MITLTREEAQQVLDALEDVIDDAEEPHKTKNAFEFLRAKLSEPEIQLGITYEEANQPEPVAWGIANTRPTEKQSLMMVMLDEPEPSHMVVPLYTTPPQRKECLRCGKVNPADIHTCTPMTVKNIQTSDKNA